MSLPPWPQKANHVRKLQKHLRWLEEIRDFGTALDDEDMRAGAHVLATSVRNKIEELRLQKSDSAHLTPPY